MPFTILTWNIWFSPKEQKVRLNNLIKKINELNPDVICLQEVTLPIARLLISNLEKKYPYNFCPFVFSYSNAIFSKYPLFNTRIFKFNNSNMGRNLICGTIKCNDQEIIVFSSHLESEFHETNSIKIEQYNTVVNTLNHLVSNKLANNVIFCGDTNMVSSNDNKVDNKNLIDAFSQTKNPNMIFTYDYKTNNYIKKNFQSRLDRVLYKFDKLRQKEYTVIDGNNISDHHGILVKFD